MTELITETTEDTKQVLYQMVKKAQIYADVTFPKQYAIFIRETGLIDGEDFKLIAEGLIKNICDFLDIDIQGFVGKCRARPYVYGRCMFAVYCRSMYRNVSLTRIGSVINRDHATIIHYQKKHEEHLRYRDYSEQYRMLVEYLDNF